MTPPLRLTRRGQWCADVIAGIVLAGFFVAVVLAAEFAGVLPGGAP